MLGWILLGMTADIIYTKNKEANEAKIQKKKDELRSRLKKSMTFGHIVACTCTICVNRRKDIEFQLLDLK